VLVGTVPARVIYLNTLEIVKAQVNIRTSVMDIPESTRATIANFCAGASASLATQTVAVPIDVISQRQMIQSVGSSGSSSIDGIQVVRQIIAQEGVKGLYRGYFTSLGMYVPSSAIWWGCYGFYTNQWWRFLDAGGESVPDIRLEGSGDTMMMMQNDEMRGEDNKVPHEVGNLTLKVQVFSGISAGMTSSLFTTPLDVVKTRLQVAPLDDAGRAPSLRMIVSQLLHQDGIRGLWRGLLPRMINVSLWGTTMVSAYEFLKRQCVIDSDN